MLFCFSLLFSAAQADFPPIFAGCYIAVSQKVDVKSALTKVGLLSDKPDVVPEDQSWFERLMSGGGSTLALAILCNKALFPIRTPITLALTPPVARFLRSRKIIKN